MPSAPATGRTAASIAAACPRRRAEGADLVADVTP
jgi:hypothetical protein